MKIKNKREEKFLMCAGCGRTFSTFGAFSEELLLHQEDNPDCKGYFKIEVVNKGIAVRQV